MTRVGVDDARGDAQQRRLPAAVAAADRDDAAGLHVEVDSVENWRIGTRPPLHYRPQCQRPDSRWGENLELGGIHEQRRPEVKHVSDEARRMPDLDRAV